MLTEWWQGKYVYAGGGLNGVWVVDVSNPLKPTLAKQINVQPPMPVFGVMAIGDLLAVASSEQSRVVLMDISDPVNPKPIAGGDFNTKSAKGVNTNSYMFNIIGGFAYFGRQSGGGGSKPASEQFEQRIQFDDRGFAITAAYSQHGDFVYVAMPANRGIEQLDLLNGTAAGTFVDSGYSPDGVAVTSDDRFVLAAAYLSRELTVYDTTQSSGQPAQRLALLDTEPLAPAILRGKQLFNDAADPRLTSSGYIACAECHLDGDSDGRVWDFTQRGEGLRNTTSLLGHAGTGDGPIHWTGNFDEVQDFEGDIRNQFLGTGLMSDADYHSGTRDQSLGEKKVGLSPDLDALAAYLTSLKSEPVSPFRAQDGSLTPAAQRGKVLFESAGLGCTTCHTGARLTDSHFVTPTAPLLHDVGTLTAASGQRLGQLPTGIDTPTLHSLWTSPPYLHDGSAPTVRDVLTTHNPNDKQGKTSNFTGANLDDLVTYLLSLDGRRE